MRVYWPETDNWKNVIDNFSEKEPIAPLHEQTLSFLQSLSRYILKDSGYRSYPELIALAYWLRKTHIYEIVNEINKKLEGKYVKARGTALHFAPANVDTIFVYSWVMSMLAGNKNIVRISSRQQTQTELLLKAIIDCLKEEKYELIAERTVILNYGHDKEITAYLSKICHLRVIWGGDETINSIRSIPVSPLAQELVFPNRFSLATINAKSIIDSNDIELKRLIHNFYNDSFGFDQMACSSPRLIAWIGDHQNIMMAKSRFWDALNTHNQQMYREISSAVQIQKLSTGYYFSTKKESDEHIFSPNFSRIKVNFIEKDARGNHCGGGFFIEIHLKQLTDLVGILDDRDQTLSYYGFLKEELLDLIEIIKNRGIDRIVPIGNALDFQKVWDGNDLFLFMTREISLL